jgi:hypothetical protein
MDNFFKPEIEESRTYLEHHMLAGYPRLAVFFFPPLAGNFHSRINVRWRSDPKVVEILNDKVLVYGTNPPGLSSTCFLCLQHACLVFKRQELTHALDSFVLDLYGCAT